MADITSTSTHGLPSPASDDDRPIAVRRKRRASSNIPSSPVPARIRNAIPGINTPPATPQRNKKRVRFSDPGPAILSTGLTPFVRRASLGTPSNARLDGTPSSSRKQSGRWNLAIDDTPISGTLQFAPLRQVLEGRVQRRIRRNRLSEEVNIIESEKRHGDKVRRETELLKALLLEKDLEIAALREDQEIASQVGEEAGLPVNVSQDDVQELESQVAELRAELEMRHAQDGEQDWNIIPQYPDEEDDDMFMPTYDDEFNEDDSDIITSTPSKRRTAPVSPPLTAPTTPSKGLAGVDALTQTSIPDPVNLLLQEQLHALEDDIASLNAAIEMTHTTHERLHAKLNEYTEECSDIDSALDKVLTDLALSQSATTETTQRLSALNQEVRSLGFSSNPTTAISQLKAQFRQARIELERLHPGEQVTGFDNSKILEMLVDRVRFLTSQVHDQDSDIDQYHEQEMLLRQQLSGRIDANRSMEEALAEAQSDIMHLTNDVSDRDRSTQRLTAALDGYRAEVAGLEKLITTMEADHRAHTASLKQAVSSATEAGDQRVLDAQLSYDILLASHQGQDMIVAELTQRLSAALSSISSLTTALSRRETTIAQQGRDIALSEARVVELCKEIEVVSEALKRAHEEIRLLRAENAGLVGQVAGEKGRYEEVMVMMQRQLGCIIATANGLSSKEGSSAMGSYGVVEQGSGDAGAQGQTVVRSGEWLRGGLARRISGAKKRRCDSGVGVCIEE